MRCPQFSIRTLLWLTLVVAAFLGGIEYQRRMAVVDYDKFVPIAAIDLAAVGHVSQFLERNGIETIIEGSVVYGVSVAPDQELRARSLLRADSAAAKYWIEFN